MRKTPSLFLFYTYIIMSIINNIDYLVVQESLVVLDVQRVRGCCDILRSKRMYKISLFTFNDLRCLILPLCT